MIAELKFTLLLVTLVLAIADFHTTAAQQPNRNQNKVQETFSAGNVLLANGKINEAIEKYTEGIAIEPSVPLLYLNRGVAYVSVSRLSEAQLDADKALALFAAGSNTPKNVAIAYQIKGLVNEKLGQYNLAAELYSKAIELDPTNAKYRNGRGNAYRLLKDYDSSLKDFDTAIQLDPRQPMFYTNRSAIKRHMKDLQASLDDLNKSLELDKNYAPSYFGRANTYLELKRYKEASKDFDAAISLKPKSEYYHGRARLYFILTKYDLAIKDNSEAIKLESTNAEAFANRAIAYSRIGSYQSAIEDIRRAIALNGDSSINRYRLGYLLYQVGKFSEAVAEVSQSIKFMPDWREPYLLRAHAYVKLGATEKATNDRQTAAKLSPGNNPTDDYVVFTTKVEGPENINH